MLWYKAWLESRPRFLASLATLTIFSIIFVQHALYISCESTFPCRAGFANPGWRTDFNRVLFIAHQFVAMMWVLTVVLLGMGGVLREKAVGTSPFTLGLPVSRMRMVVVRIGMGIFQAIILGFVPWAGIYTVSTLARMPISASQAGFYVLLLVVGGVVYFSMAVLVSSLVSGEYTAPAIAFGIVLLAAVLFDAWLRRFNVWRLVTGDFSINRTTYLLSEHLPWAGLLASLIAAILFFTASVIAVQRRDL